MKFEELFSNSFQHLRAAFQTSEQLLQPMVGKMFSTESRFCLEAVAARLMSLEGMQRAAQRYLLGRSRSNETVFWMIDERQRVRDGMVGDSWASVLLKERGIIDRQWCPQHCLFGLHLLSLAESAESADLLSLAESAESADLSSLAENAESADLLSLAESAESANLSSLAENAESADLSSLAESAESADLLSLAESAENADLSSLAESAENADLSSLAESAESADLSSLAENAESAERTPLKFAIRSKISAISAISARQSETICVVESVRSCVVLSERFPKYLWMATGYLANLNERLFLPLKGHRVVCFPATDPTGDTYLLWLSVAKEARKYGIDITVSRLLEDQASPKQKEQCVDLLEFLYNTNLQK